MFKYRPLSPHLTVYNIQSSSLFSIWHRITAMFNFLFLSFSFLILKLFTWGFLIDTIQGFLINYTTLKSLLGIVCISFLYHFLNGYRHFSWDLDIFLTSTQIPKSAFFLVGGLFGIFILNWVFLF